MNRNLARRGARLIISIAFAITLAITLASGMFGSMPTADAMGAAHNACWRTHVQLHGSDAPTMTCLVLQQPTTATQIAQATLGQSGCSIFDLQLFQDAQYGGAEICFEGIGSANLTDYWIAWPFYIWNDQMSSYKTGANWGIFSWDVNAGKPQYPYQDNLLCPWIGSYWNDQISYISINTNIDSDPQHYC